MPRTKNTRPAKRTKPKEYDLKKVLKRDLNPALEKLVEGAKEKAGERNWITSKEYSEVMQDASILITIMEILTMKQVAVDRQKDSELARNVLKYLSSLKKQSVVIEYNGSTHVLKRGRNTVQLQFINMVVKHIKHNVHL